MLKRCFVLLCLLLLTACATDSFARAPRTDAGAVAGQLTGGATRPYAVLVLPAGAGWAMNITTPKAYPDDDGNFLLPDLAPGRYVLAGFSDGQRPYWFNRKAGAGRCVIVRAGEVAYLGSYRLIEGQSAELTERFYGLEAREDRDAATVLARLQAQAGSAWAAVIARSLSRLPKPAPVRAYPACEVAP